MLVSIWMDHCSCGPNLASPDSTKDREEAFVHSIDRLGWCEAPVFFFFLGL